MKHLVTATLLLVGVIHLLPLAGVFGNEALGKLYGVTINEPNLSILMRHRAVLFATIGLFFCAAAFHAPLQVAAFWMGLASVLGFMLLAWLISGYNPQISRVIAVDWVALALLSIGAICKWHT
jgi:hypothetical protein